MITILTALGFIALLFWWWARWHSRLPELAVRYLCVGPFLPLVSLFNHNFNGDRFGTLVRTAPIHVAAILLALSIIEWRRAGYKVRLGFEGPFLLLYAIVCLMQVPFSVDPTWAFISWSFSVPGYALFLLAGSATRLETLESNRRLFALTVLGFVGIQVALITYGLFTGKATDLVQTRNFGSVWAGNTMLAFLILFGGLAWVAIRGSSTLVYAFLATTLLSMFLTLSRSALMVLGVYAVFLTVPTSAKRGRIVVSALIALGTLAIAFVALRERLGLDAQLIGNWLTRFQGGDVLGALDAARVGRHDEFAEYADALLRSNPFFGTGFGTFRSFSIYSDAHNLLLTEAFENSLASAILVTLAFGLPRAVRALFTPNVRSIGMSIIGFLVLAQITGGMLSYRSWDNYYATYPGWILFFMVGVMAAAARAESAVSFGLSASAIRDARSAA